MGRRPLLLLRSLLGALASATLGCTTQSSSCTAVAINRPMTYDAALPAGLDAGSTTIEICFDTTCDTSRLKTSANPNVTGIRCEDVDGKTPAFPTECTFDDASRKLAFTTNTVYGGHAGSSTLMVAAIAASGTRTEILRGTVTFQDTSDDTARAACTTAWEGTFHPS